MARVAVSHPGMTSDDAKVPPVRTPVPQGDYITSIVSCTPGTTKSKPILNKITVEFQILYGITEESDNDPKEQGRRVFQDFVLEPDDRWPDLAETKRHELVMLLEACDAEYDDSGFDTDDIANKSVKITVRHRTGKEKNPDTGKFPIFTNVVRIDTAEAVGEEDIV